MTWLKWTLYALCALLLLPFAGPWLGLAGFHKLAHAPDSYVETPDGRLNVVIEGAGPVVVLVHGQPGSLDWMRPLAGALQDQGYTTVRYDRMGWGHSDQRPEGIHTNPTAHARDLLALIGALDLKRPPVVVGYSYGGGVAMEANRLDPESVPTLVLVSSVGGPVRRDGGSFLGRVLFSAPVVRWTFNTDFIAKRVAPGLFASLEHPQRLSLDERDRFMATLALPGVPSHWARERQERYQGFDGYAPAAVRGCTLILHGTDDQVVVPDVARYLNDEIEGSVLAWLPDAGHATVVIDAVTIAAHVRASDDRCRAVR